MIFDDEDKLQAYYEQKGARTYLINSYCEARLEKDDKNRAYYYVKEKRGRLFISSACWEINVYTTWHAIEENFSESTTYENLKAIYINIGRNGKTATFHESFISAPQTETSAQNEYCRMEMKNISNNEIVLECSEIWGEFEYDRPKKFIIKGEKELLCKILEDFKIERRENQKMFDYNRLKDFYLKNEKIKVIEPKDKFEERTIDF